MKMTTHWWIVIGLFLTLNLVPPPAAQAGAEVKLDILFMNHGPMQPVIKNIKKILAGHSQTATAVWYDFESSSGQDFRRQNNIKGHIPLLIYLNGSPTWELEGRKVTFAGFPSGYGPYQFRGKWSLEDLDRLLGSPAASEGKRGTQP